MDIKIPICAYCISFLVNVVLKKSYLNMKKYIFITSITISLLMFFACKKKDTSTPDTAATTTSGTVTSPSTFTWSENGGATQTADSAEFRNAYNTLYAFKGGLARYFEINYSASIVGSYTLSTTGSNSLNYIVQTGTINNVYTANSGTANITANTSGKLSGNFTGSYSSGTLTSISGGFTNVFIK